MLRGKYFQNKWHTFTVFHSNDFYSSEEETVWHTAVIIWLQWNGCSIISCSEREWFRVPVVVQNCVDLSKIVPCSWREMPSHEVNEVIDVKVQEVSDIWDNPVAISFPPIKTKHEFSCTYVYIIRHISQKYVIVYCLRCCLEGVFLEEGIYNFDVWHHIVLFSKSSYQTLYITVYIFIF